jgi:DNA-directed RNA polymerase specialized sigma24 family protein
MPDRSMLRSCLLAFACCAGFAQAQESEAPFHAAVLTVDLWSRIDVVLDVDRDGLLDGAGVWTDRYDVRKAWLRAYRNDGRGVFPTTVPIASFTMAVNDPDSLHTVKGDFDGDGWADLAVWSATEVRAFINDGGAMTLGAVAAFGAPPVVVAVGDFDGDGKTDLAVLDAGAVNVLRGPSFAAGPGLAVTGSHAFVCEANGDGIADVGVIQGTRVALLAVIGGALTQVGSYEHGIASNHMPASGDADGDGDQDLVVFGKDSYALLRRTGAGTFVGEPLAIGGPATGLADLDGDGDLDGVCCSGGGPTSYPNERPSTFHVSLNDGSGAFALASTIAGLGARQLAGAVDVDRDGDVDLVAGRAVWFNRGALAAAPQPLVASAADADKLRLVDVDRDADPDFAVDVANWLWNRGDGSFERDALRMPSAPPGTTWVGPGYQADWNGDGTTDVVVGHEDGAGALVSMRLWLNRGGGGFVDAGPAGPPGVAFQPTPVGAKPEYGDEFRAAVDLDGDGDLDLVSHRLDTSPMRNRFWYNDGQGRFSDGGEWFWGHVVLAAGRFDGDGTVDLLALAASAASWGEMGIALGNGNGAFGGGTRWVRFGQGHGRYDRPAVADVDGDGDLDVLGFDSGNALILFRNTGGPGIFTPERLTTSIGIAAQNQKPTRMFITDLDGDGRRDLFAWPIAWSGERSAYVALQQPNGTFRQLASQILIPHHVVDVDGDGDADVVGERLVRNLTFAGAAAGRRVQYGTPRPGSDGMLPVLGAKGPFRRGALADSRIRGALGGTFGVYFVGTQQVAMHEFPLPGLVTYAFPFVVPIAITRRRERRARCWRTRVAVRGAAGAGHAVCADVPVRSGRAGRCCAHERAAARLRRVTVSVAVVSGLGPCALGMARGCWVRRPRCVLGDAGSNRRGAGEARWSGAALRRSTERGIVRVADARHGGRFAAWAGRCPRVPRRATRRGIDGDSGGPGGCIANRGAGLDGAASLPGRRARLEALSCESRPGLDTRSGSGWLVAADPRRGARARHGAARAGARDDLSLSAGAARRWRALTSGRWSQTTRDPPLARWSGGRQPAGKGATRRSRPGHGDEPDWQRLSDRLLAAARRTCSRRSHGLVEDLWQDVLLELWIVSRRGYPVRGWESLGRCLCRRLLERTRANNLERAAFPVPESEHAAPELRACSEGVDRIESTAAETLLATVGRWLTARQTTVLDRFVHSNLTHAAFAGEFGVSIKDMRRTLRGIVKRLAKHGVARG